MKRMKGHDMDIRREILFKCVLLGGFDGGLARDDCADFSCYV
jgi:hypothetical protein